MILGAAIVLAVSTLQAAAPAMPKSCHMPGMNQPSKMAVPAGKAVKFVPLAMVVGLLKMTPEVEAFKLAVAPDQQGQNKKGTNEHCPHQQEVQRWREWRVRNPHAKSRYGGNNINVEVQHFVGPLPDPADDIEPDPPGWFGGCGCDLEFALSKPDGCGWWHSQVWSLKGEK